MLSEPQNPQTITIFNLLARQRSAVAYRGQELTTVLNRLSFLEQNVLIELRQPSQPSGYLLTQHGWGVAAQCGVLLGDAAADHLLTHAHQGDLRLFALSAASAALAYSAVTSAPLPIDTRGYSSVSGHLDTLAQQQFSGVVAIRSQQSVLIRQLVRGRLSAQQELFEAGTFEPFLQYAWTDQPLPRLTIRLRPSPTFGEAQPATVAHPPAPSSSSDTYSPVTPGQGSQRPEPLIWAHFQRVLEVHLGDAAFRLYSLSTAQYGNETGETLGEILGSQVDRVAGHAVGLEFRRQIAPALLRSHHP